MNHCIEALSQILDAHSAGALNKFSQDPVSSDFEPNEQRRMIKHKRKYGAHETKKKNVDDELKSPAPQ